MLTMRGLSAVRSSVASVVAVAMMIGGSVVLSGCGDGGGGGGDSVDGSGELEQQYSSAEELRPMFESVAQTGQHPGSGMAGIDSAIEGITDPDQKAKVQKAIDGINTASSAGGRKAAAKAGLEAL